MKISRLCHHKALQPTHDSKEEEVFIPSIKTVAHPITLRNQIMTKYLNDPESSSQVYQALRASQTNPQSVEMLPKRHPRSPLSTIAHNRCTLRPRLLQRGLISYHGTIPPGASESKNAARKNKHPLTQVRKLPSMLSGHLRSHRTWACPRT